MPQLLDLPFEIREHIWKDVLYNSYGSIEPKYNEGPGLSECLEFQLNASICDFLEPLKRIEGGLTVRVDDIRVRIDEYLALFRVNRQIRHETRPIFFAVNRFCFRRSETLRTHVARYPNAFALTHVTSIEAALDFEDKKARYSWTFNPNFVDTITALRCLKDATRLKNLYISISIPTCKHQSWVEGMLSEYLRPTVGLGPTITVQLDVCLFCESNDCTPEGICRDRNLWIWQCQSGSTAWQVYQRLDWENRNRFGVVIRGREKEGGTWKRRIDASYREILDCWRVKTGRVPWA
jgi:hypothetical protein